MGDDDGFVIRLRGLPWSATEQEVVQFFGDEIEIVDGEDGVHFTYSREGRPSGEAFLELTSEEDMEKALKKHNEHMGNRYIEVFRSKKSEMEWVIKRAGPNQTTGTSEAVVRLRGLPFGCSKEEIAQFFTGLEIVPNGIMLPEDRQGRSTGEAYVQFATQAIAEEALNKHKERIGHRYIEIFKSSLQEAYSAMGIGMGGGMGQMRPRPLMGIVRPSPYDRSERFGGMGGMSSMGSGGMGMGSYGRGRGGRNVKGFYDDDFDDYSGGYSGGGMGMSSGMSMGGMNMGMNRRGNMRQQRVMGSRMGMGMGSGMGGSGMSMGGMSTSNRDRGAVPGSHYVSKTGHSVHMRGLPFQALESDIAEFFSPLVPVKVEFEFSPNGRPTGEANVDFSTHQEAVEAMKKHKSNMQHRYIELFLNSTPAGRGDSFGSGGSMGGGGGFGGDMRDNFNNFSNGDGYNDMGGMENYGGKSKLGGYGGMSGGGMGSNMGGGMGGSMGGGMGGMGSNYTAF